MVVPFVTQQEVSSSPASQKILAELLALHSYSREMVWPVKLDAAVAEYLSRSS